MEATVDPLEWRTELERVAPRLKIPRNFSGKEWRAHLEQTQKHEKVGHLSTHHTLDTTPRIMLWVEDSRGVTSHTRVAGCCADHSVSVPRNPGSTAEDRQRGREHAAARRGEGKVPEQPVQ